MAKVWKYPLVDNQTTVQMPQKSIIRHVGQDPATGMPCLWVQVSGSTAFKEDRKFEWFGTGHELTNEALFGEFVGTAICGSFVWHVFETTMEESL